MKKAIITGGSSFHQNFFTNKNGKYKDFFDEKIYLPTLKDKSLDEFELVILASRLHPRFMCENFDKIRSYLDKGGNVVYFPEPCEGLFPQAKFKETEVNFWWWILPNADLPMYKADEKASFWKFLEIKECKWHYHGTFIHDDKIEKILVNEYGESILCKDSTSFKGNLYLSALDPDFHLGQGFMPITEPFFDKFMQWVEFDLKAKQ